MSYFFMHYKESNGRETYRHFKSLEDLDIFRQRYLPGTKVTVTHRAGYTKQDRLPVVTVFGQALMSLTI